jgi:hypothetical protein
MVLGPMMRSRCSRAASSIFCRSRR